MVLSMGLIYRLFFAIVSWLGRWGHVRLKIYVGVAVVV